MSFSGKPVSTFPGHALKSTHKRAHGESRADDRTADLHAIGNENALRGLYGTPMELALLKQLGRLYLALQFPGPRAVLRHRLHPARKGTDVSPRGDAPGFARVLDDYTIAIPDRPGNNRLDTMSNIVADAEVGLLFFIPGIDETLRINGTARLSQDPELLAAAAVNGREPRLVILVTVKEAFLHCGKALKRSSSARRLPDREELPVAGPYDHRDEACQMSVSNRRTRWSKTATAIIFIRSDSAVG